MSGTEQLWPLLKEATPAAFPVANTLLPIHNTIRVLWLSRFFIIHMDGSGTELLRSKDVEAYLAEACGDPAVAVLQEPVQEYPGRKTLFIV